MTVDAGIWLQRTYTVGLSPGVQATFLTRQACKPTSSTAASWPMYILATLFCECVKQGKLRSIQQHGLILCVIKSHNKHCLLLHVHGRSGACNNP